MSVGDLKNLRKDQDKLRLLFVFLAAGQVEADINPLRECYHVHCLGQKRIDLPGILKKGEGLQNLT